MCAIVQMSAAMCRRDVQKVILIHFFFFQQYENKYEN